MSYAVQVDESNGTRRTVYLWCVQSNGTSAATNEGGGRGHMSIGALSMWTTANTLSAMSANAGFYSLILGASDISLLGTGAVHYSSTTALPTSVNVQVVGYDPFVAYSRFTSADSVGLKAQTHSGATVAGIVSDVSVRNGEYSAVTVRTSVVSGHTPQTGDNFARLGAPAGASVGADIAAVKVDTAAIKVKTDQVVFTVANRVDSTINSAVTLAAGRYSNVSIGGVEKVESAVTINTGGIVAASFGASAIDAVALATDAGQEIADRIIARNIAGGSDSGRTVGEALAILRNRVFVDGSTVTVYKTDDTTSFWTGSVGTVSANSGVIQQINPQG